MFRRLSLVAMMLVVQGCGPRTPVVTPEMRAAQQVAEADALVNAGCFDCLTEALLKYEEARSVQATSAVATAGAVRTATLLALRERELGFVDSNRITRAGELLANARPDAQAALKPLLEMAASMPYQGGGQRGSPVTNDAQISATAAAWRNREAWTAQLQTVANDDALSAYMFVAFNCAYSVPTSDNVTTWVASLAETWRTTPLLKYRIATCGNFNESALEALLDADPRFVEMNYFVGTRAILTGELDEASRLLQVAYAWHPQWPGVTQTIANVYLTAEDFDQSIAYFDRTLELAANHPDALLGKVKALTYLGRNAEAIATIDQLLALGQWLIGDARYWRAFNEVQMSRLQEAWVDVEEAGKLLVNAQVPKLAGIVAYRLQQLDTARAKFEESRGRNPSDCETGFYLGVVEGDLRSWARVPQILIDTAACLQTSNDQLRGEIERLRASEEPPERKARKIAKHDQTILQQERMLATSWFNTAVAYYNLQQKAEARQFAEKVTSDHQFGERARQILERLGSVSSPQSSVPSRSRQSPVAVTSPQSQSLVPSLSHQSHSLITVSITGPQSVDD